MSYIVLFFTSTFNCSLPTKVKNIPDHSYQWSELYFNVSFHVVKLHRPLHYPPALHTCLQLSWIATHSIACPVPCVTHCIAYFARNFLASVLDCNASTVMHILSQVSSWIAPDSIAHTLCHSPVDYFVCYALHTLPGSFLQLYWIAAHSIARGFWDAQPPVLPPSTPVSSDD